MAKKKKKGLQVVGNIDFKDERNGLKVVGKVDFDDNNNITNKTAFIQQQDIAPVKQTGFFNDAKGSTLQKIGNTAVDATGNILKGGFSSLEGLADFGRYRGADVLDFFGANKKAKEVRKTAKANTTEEIFSSINHILSGDLAGKVNENDLAAFKDIKEGSYLGDKGSQVFQGVGNSATNAALSALGGNVGGMTSLFMSAAGNAQSEAYQEGATDFQAGIYGALSGSVEAATEMMFGGLGKITQNLGFGTGALDDQLINRFTRKLSNTIAKNAVDLGLRSAGEGVEEVVAGFGNAILQKLIYMQDEDFSKLLKDQKLMDSFVSGALSSALMQAPTTLSATMQGRESSTGFTENEREVYNRELENRLKAEEKLTKRRRTQIEEQLNQDFERGYVNAQNIRDILGDRIDLQKDTRLAESFNEETRRTQAYENDVSKYDEKQAKVIQTAIDSGLLNNSNKTHDMVDLIAKLSADKDIDFDFTNNERIKDSGFAIDGRQVNGFVKDGTVNLNLESNQVLNKTVGHEITHVLEGTELYDNLQQSLKAYIGEKEWNNRISQLEKVYQNVKGANIQNELTSDLVGEHIFNDENFIRNLSTKNPNLFQKIFDEIKYMVKIATAGSKEARDLEKVKRAFEKAYRESSKTQQGTQYQLDNQDNLIDVTNETTGYENVSNKLLGFSSSIAEQKGFNETKYPYTLDLQISVDGGKTYFEDSIKGMNRKQAIERAKRNWGKDAILKETSKTQEGIQYSINQLTDDGITMTYVRNPNSNASQYKNINQDFGQDLEPSGEYMSMDTMEGKNKIDGYEYGTIQFKNPLVIDNEDTTSNGWKKDLSNMYNGLTGKELSNAIMQDGYDAVMSRDNKGNIVEVVNLNGTKQNNQNTKYSLTEDSQGRELSKEQQEFFKDSKVRDDEGNLMVMNHATADNTFTVFEKNTQGKNSAKYFKQKGGLGEGFYFSDEEMAYKMWNNYVEQETQKPVKSMKVYLDIKNPYYVTDTEISKDIKSYINDKGINPPKMKTNRDALYFANLNNINIQNMLKELGYDGIIERDTNNIYQAVAFESNQIKNVDNTNPTSNPDIRYSLSNDEMQDLIKKEERRFNGFTVEQLDKEIGYAISSRDEMTKLSNELTKEYKELQKTDEFMKALQNYDFDSEVMQKANEYADKIRYYDNQRDKYQAQYEAINNLLMGEQKDTRTNQQIIEEAQKHFGTTDNFKEAGYITTDGNMLDFSGFHEGGQKGQRSLDHRQINEIDTDMDSFIGMGNIRILPEGGGINLEVEPTAQQYSKLRDYIDYVNDEVYIDVDKPNGTYDSARYKKGTSATKIINDIKTYFETGSFPQQSEYADFYYSLQRNNEVAPTSGWEVRSEDVRLQSAFKDAIAPIQEQVQELSNTINELKESIPQREYRPLTEQEGEQLAEEYANRDISNELAPVRENLTEEENNRLEVLDLLERNNMLDEEHQYERDQLLEKANPTIPNEEATPGKALADIRDIDEVGKRSVKAYQYEHPEVKPYFQEEARKMLSDLKDSIKGERFMWESRKRGQGTNYEFTATTRQTSSDIARLLDGDLGYKYSYDDIRKGLNAIIEDHGAENIAVAKRIEFILDERLRNGYDDWGVYDNNGEQYHVAPNSDYLNMLKEQEWENYFEDLNKQYPFDLEEPAVEENVPDHYSIEDEDVSDMKIDKDLQDMTVDDINLEPFLEGLQKASDRQAERQQLREELNQKREVKIPKETNGRKAWNKFKSLFVNEFAVVDDYAKRHNAPEIKHKTDTWNNYLATAQYNIETAQTDMNGKAIGRSGNSIFQEAQKLGLKDTFDTYLKHWANVDRAKQGKGANYEAKESYKIVKEMEAKNPELKRLGKDMWQYYRNARHNLRDAGIINQQTSDMLGRMYPHYTPYVSENIENYFTPTGELKPKSTIKRAKGGAVLEGLLSAEEAMQMYTKSQFNTIFGNDAFRSIVKTSNNQVEMVDNRTSYVNADNLYTDKDGYYLTAYENGDAITAKISEEMYKALSRESKTRVQDLENTFRPVGKVLSTLSNVRRNILTSWSPTFIAKNFIKDYQEALFNSKYTADFAKNYPSAFKELATNTGEAQQFKALYGSGLTMGQFDMDSINYNPNAKNFNFLKGIKNANELIELAPRYAEFKASRENGASIQEAMYNAREVTTNFSRGGVITKAFNKYGMTFLNSSVQGFDKFIRNFSGENGAKGVVNSLAKAVIFGIAPAVFNELAFGSGDDKDEEYEAIPDYIKDNYYIIKTGDGNFIRIPKGRVLSVFGSAARRTIEAMEGEENAFEGYWNNVQQQIGINNPEENNIFAPFIQAMGGRKLDSGQTAGEAWYGGDIIPSRLQKERPEDQYDASIDKLSIWLGEKTGISPYKINYVLDQYSGGIGDLILPMITDEANSDGSIIAPIKDQFTADSTTDNKYVSEFYDTKGKLYTGSKATDEDILKNKYMNSISSEMAKLYAERREVQADDSLTKKQKYAKSQEIKAEINRLAKEGMDNYNDIIMSNNYAKIGDTEYYKNANGQWTKVNDDVASLGLDTEEKNEYYKVKNDIYTTKKNNDGYDKPLVIQDIVNSNLTPDAKVNLYTSNYKDDLIQPLVDSGMDVDSYLEYKSQDFRADKDKNGKSISGSKKRKVFDYINSMNIPYEQKLILAKSEYNSFNQNNYDIINYIENSGMSYDERIELYKNLGFKVDGDNISW